MQTVRNSLIALQLTGCGGTYTALNGYLQSYNYPGPYLDYMNCDYIITLPAGYTIALSFVDFNTEEWCDYLTVRIAG